RVVLGDTVRRGMPANVNCALLSCDRQSYARSVPPSGVPLRSVRPKRPDLPCYSRLRRWMIALLIRCFRGSRSRAAGMHPFAHHFDSGFGFGPGGDFFEVRAEVRIEMFFASWSQVVAEFGVEKEGFAVSLDEQVLMKCALGHHGRGH